MNHLNYYLTISNVVTLPGFCILRLTTIRNEYTRKAYLCNSLNFLQNWMSGVFASRVWDMFYWVMHFCIEMLRNYAVKCYSIPCSWHYQIALILSDKKRKKFSSIETTDSQSKLQANCYWNIIRNTLQYTAAKNKEHWTAIDRIW